MHASKRVAVIGSAGQLGHDLVGAFSDRHVIALTHDEIAIEDRGSVERALDVGKPDLVINTAAFHHVATCETRQREALLVNAVGVGTLARACAEREIVFATVSTDYVFDGRKGAPYTEWDEPHPRNVYGVSKLAGEMLAVSGTPAHYIFRTSGLFGKAGSKSKGYTFIDTILQKARAGEPLKVVTDMTFSPSYTLHVARAMRAIIEAAPFGLYHVTNAGSCTWFEFAEEALSAAGIEAQIAPIVSADWSDGVRRPANSALAHEALLSAGIEDLPHWKNAVAQYLQERSFTGTPLK